MRFCGEVFVESPCSRRCNPCSSSSRQRTGRSSRPAGAEGKATDFITLTAIVVSLLPFSPRKSSSNPNISGYKLLNILVLRAVNSRCQLGKKADNQRRRRKG